MGFINYFLGSIISFVADNLLLLQFISVLISGVLLIYTVYYLVGTGIVRNSVEHFINILGTADINKRRALRGWRQIIKRLKTKDPVQMKLAILEADKILSEILRMAGYPGKNLDERLELSDANQISNIKELQQAHKMRNRLAAESGFSVSFEEANMILGIYKRTFQSVNLIE